MKFSDGRGLKTAQWLPNEIVASQDINFLHQSGYQNTLDALRLRARQETKDEVMSGLEFPWSASRTFILKPGAVLSFSGKYFLSDVWAFVASPGDAFIAVVPVDQPVSFDAGGAYERIDIVEIRPVQISYNNSARNFKDPITGFITSAILGTRLEYGYEFSIKKGDEGTIQKEAWTWTVNSGTTGANIKNKYILFSTHLYDYYVWYNTDGTGSDPLVAGRIGIPVTPAAADNYVSIALLTQMAIAAAVAASELSSYSLADGKVYCTATLYTNITDATNGNVGAYFDAISVVQGNGPKTHTSGWIKLLEVFVGAGVTSLSNSNVRTFSQSNTWYGEPGTVIDSQLFDTKLTSIGSLPTDYGESLPVQGKLIDLSTTPYLDEKGKRFFLLDHNTADVVLENGNWMGRSGSVTSLLEGTVDARIYSGKAWAAIAKVNIKALPPTSEYVPIMRARSREWFQEAIDYNLNESAFAFPGTNYIAVETIKQDVTHVLVGCSDQSGFKLYVNRATISGTTITPSATYNTIYDGTASSAYVTSFHMVMLDSTHVAIIFKLATLLEIRTLVGTLSGDTITCTAGVQVFNNQGDSHRVIPLDATHYAIVYRHYGAGAADEDFYVNLAYYNGSTVTLGTETRLSAAAGSSPFDAWNFHRQACDMVAFSSTYGLIFWTEYGDKLNYRTFTRTGNTTYSLGTTVQAQNKKSVVVVRAIRGENQLGVDRFVLLLVYADEAQVGFLPGTWQQSGAVVTLGKQYLLNRMGAYWTTEVHLQIFEYLDNNRFAFHFSIANASTHGMFGYISEDGLSIASVTRAQLDRSNGSNPCPFGLIGCWLTPTKWITGEEDSTHVILKIYNQPMAEITVEVNNANFRVTTRKDYDITVRNTATIAASTGIHYIGFQTIGGSSARLIVDGSSQNISGMAIPVTLPYNRRAILSVMSPASMSIYWKELMIDQKGKMTYSELLAHNTSGRVWNAYDANNLLLNPVGKVAIKIPGDYSEFFQNNSDLLDALAEIVDEGRSVITVTAEDDIRRGNFVWAFDTKVSPKMRWGTTQPVKNLSWKTLQLNALTTGEQFGVFPTIREHRKQSGQPTFTLCWCDQTSKIVYATEFGLLSQGYMSAYYTWAAGATRLSASSYYGVWTRSIERVLHAYIDAANDMFVQRWGGTSWDAGVLVEAGTFDIPAIAVLRTTGSGSRFVVTYRSGTTSRARVGKHSSAVTFVGASVQMNAAQQVVNRVYSLDGNSFFGVYNYTAASSVYYLRVGNVSEADAITFQAEQDFTSYSNFKLTQIDSTKYLMVGVGPNVLNDYITEIGILTVNPATGTYTVSNLREYPNLQSFGTGTSSSLEYNAETRQAICYAMAAGNEPVLMIIPVYPEDSNWGTPSMVRWPTSPGQFQTTGLTFMPPNYLLLNGSNQNDGYILNSEARYGIHAARICQKPIGVALEDARKGELIRVKTAGYIEGEAHYLGFSPVFVGRDGMIDWNAEEWLDTVGIALPDGRIKLALDADF